MVTTQNKLGPSNLIPTVYSFFSLLLYLYLLTSKNIIDILLRLKLNAILFFAQKERNKLTLGNLTASFQGEIELFIVSCKYTLAFKLTFPQDGSIYRDVRNLLRSDCKFKLNNQRSVFYISQGDI